MLDCLQVYYNENVSLTIPPYGSTYISSDIDSIVKFLKDAVFPTIATVTFDSASKLSISIEEGVPYHHQTRKPYEWNTLKTDSPIHKSLDFRTIVFSPNNTFLKDSIGFSEAQLSSVTDNDYPTTTDYLGSHYDFHVGYSIEAYWP